MKKREYERRAERIASGKRYPSETLTPRRVPTPEERAASAERATFRGRIAGARTNAERFGVAVNDLTVDDWYEVLAEHGRRCFYCGVHPDVLWIDHFIPIARGGGNTKSNVVPSCAPCNRRKSKRSAEQFLNNLCHRDHPLWGDNLYVYPDGIKFACKTCRQASVDRSEAKRGRRIRTDK